MPPSTNWKHTLIHCNHVYVIIMVCFCVLSSIQSHVRAAHTYSINVIRVCLKKNNLLCWFDVDTKHMFAAYVCVYPLFLPCAPMYLYILINRFCLFPYFCDTQFIIIKFECMQFTGLYAKQDTKILLVSVRMCLRLLWVCV